MGVRCAFMWMAVRLARQFLVLERYGLMAIGILSVGKACQDAANILKAISTKFWFIIEYCLPRKLPIIIGRVRHAKNSMINLRARFSSEMFVATILRMILFQRRSAHVRLEPLTPIQNLRRFLWAGINLSSFLIFTLQIFL